MSETDDWVLPAGDVAAPSTPAAEVNDWQPAAPEPSAWDQMSWPERAGHQLRSGVETAGQIANTQRALGAATGLRSIGETAANWGAEATRDPEMAMAYRQMFPPRGERDINRLRGVLRDSAGNVIASRERQSQIPSSPNAAAFAEDFGQGWNRFKETWSPGEFGPAWERFKANPGDIAGQAIIPGLPVMAGAVALPIGAAALGMGTIPVLVAQFGGSAATRLSANSLGTLAEAAKQDGVNIEDADAVARWMVTRPDRVQGAVTKAGQGALAGALVDTLALGFSRPIIPRAGLGANARALGQDLAVGMVQPPAAEVASQLGMDGGIANPGGVGMAAAAGAFQGPMNAGIRSIDAASAPRIPLNYRPPGTPPAEAAGSGQPQLPPPTGGAPPGAPSGATPPVRPQPVGEAPAAAPPGGVRPYAEGAQVMVRDPATGGMVPATVRMVSDDGLHAVVATDPMDPMTFRGVAVTELQPVTNVTNVAGEYTPPLPAAPSPAEVFASGLEQATSPAVLRERQQMLHEFQTALPEGFTLQERPGGWALTIDGDPVWEVPGEYPAPEHYAEFRDILSRLANVQMPGTPAAPVQVTAPEHIAAAGAHVTQPTPGQAQAGNYPMGHVTIDGLPITIETPAGGIRSGIGEDGQPWSDEQPADYGYIKRTKGADGDRVDVYLGPAAHEAQNHPVFIIDQIAKGTGKFDEHKAMIGFPTQEAAVTAYHAAFGDGSAPERIGAVTRMPWPDFKRWATSGQTQKPLTHQDTEAPEPRSPEFQAERQLNLREGRPISLLEFLARTGGIRDPRGDLRAMDAQRKFIPGAGMLVQNNGRSLDYAREHAAQFGYLPQSAGIEDFLRLIDEELRGFPVYSGADLAQIRQMQEQDAIEREREAIRREAPAIRLLARQRGYDLTPAEVDAATWFVIEGGMSGDEAIAAALVRSAELADIEAGLDAPAGYRVEDHVLEAWAAELGLTLTPEQYEDAIDLWMGGMEAPQAVAWAGAVKPALDAEADAAAQEIPFEWSAGNVGRLDQTGDGERGGGGGGGEGQQPPAGAGAAGPPDGEGGEPAGAESAPAAEPPPAGYEPGQGGEQVQRPTAGDGSPEPQPEGYPATEPTTRPGFEGGDQYVIPGTRPVEPKPDAGEQQPGAGARPAQGPQAGITGFRTAKGSTYVVHEDGTTTRNKAARPEHPGEEGVQPRSQATYYVTADDAVKLGEFQTQGGVRRAIQRVGAGQIGVRYLSGPDMGKFERRTVVDASTTPSVGATPVEIWQDGNNVHFGNPIVEVFRARPSAPPPGGMFDPQAGAQTDLVDAVKGTRDVGNIAAPNGIGLAESFRDEFLAGKSFATILQARKVASDWLGGPVQAGSKVAKVVDEAIETGAVMAAREIAQMPPVPDGHIRLWRAGKLPAQSPNEGDGWLAQSIRESGADKAWGRWFTDDAEALAWYKNENEGQPIHYIDVPRDQAQEWKVAKHPDAAKFSRDPDIEYFLPAAEANKAKPQMTPGAVFDRLVRLYDEQMPRVGTRTADSIERQAYSTPLPLAYAASRLSGAYAGNKVFEPTAGNGALLIEVDPADAIVNELDDDRAAALKAQGFKVRQIDATTLVPPGVQVSIANPPFGTVRMPNGQNMDWEIGLTPQVRFSTTQIDHKISFNALEVLPPEGRAALIIAGVNKQVQTTEGRKKAYTAKQLRAFYAAIYKHFNVIDHFTVPGELYAKQGAAWPVDVVIIDGRRPSERPLPMVEPPPILTGWADIREKIINAPEYERLAPGGEPAGGMEPGSGSGGGAGGAGAGGNAQQGNPDVGVSERPDGQGGVDAGAGTGPRGGGGPGGAGDDVGGGGAGAAAGGAEPATGGRIPDREQLGNERPDLPAGGGQGAAATAGEEPGASGGSDQAGEPAGMGGPGSTLSGEPRLSDENQEDLAAPPPDTQEQAPAEAKPRKKGDEPTATQAAYNPHSKAEAVGTLAPMNLASAMDDALTALENRVGPLDKWVAERLGYTLDELLGSEDQPGYFSAEQVDALALGLDQIDRDGAFVIGDQTGVGKGRFVAGMMRYAIRSGLVPIFVTEKPTLYKDIVRDLIDIGMPDVLDQIVATNNNIRVPLTEDKSGPVLRTPTIAKHEADLAAMAAQGGLPSGKSMLFTTYAQMQQVQGSNTTRQRLLASIAPRSFLLLDEAHNAGGQGGKPPRPKKGKDGVKYTPVPAAQFVRNLVDASRAVAYSSATWAKRPDVMDLYARKTDMRLAVADLSNLAETIARGGIPMQQIVSAQLAAVGQFTRRERSFAGIAYELTPTPVDRQTYDDNAGLMKNIFDLYEEYVRPAIEVIRGRLKPEGGVTAADSGVGSTSLSSVGFGSTMHNVVAQMLLASKAQATVDRALEALKKGERPVIAFANTMEKMLEEYTEEVGAKFGDEMPEFGFNAILSRYLKRQLRYTIKDAFDNKTTHYLTPEDLGPEGARFYREIEGRIRKIDLSAFPASPIDYIRSKLTEAGYKVGELSGREIRVAYDGDVATYEKRPSKDLSNQGKNEAISGFNAGTLDVMMLNQSGASGLSLHSYYKFKDQRPRVMIVAQAEANIDTHMQILGRVHRTGQVTLPRYEQLVADVPAEKRPAAVLAKKMASLSASTTAARRGLLGSNEAIDFMNKYGAKVLIGILREESRLLDVMALSTGGGRGGPVDADEDGGVLDDDAALDFNPEALLTRFTGRIPLLPLKEQERIYDLIISRYVAYIAELDAAGENALEAKTLDLQAKTLETVEIKAGAPGGNPFSAPVVLQRIDARRTIKPPPPHEVVRAVLAGADPKAKLPSADALRQESIDQLARRIAAVAPEAQALRQDQIEQVNAAEARSIAGTENRFVEPIAREQAIKKIKAAAARLRSIMNAVAPGDVVSLASDGGDTGTAIFTRARLHGENPAAPSAWEFVFLMSDGTWRSMFGSHLHGPVAVEADMKEGWRQILSDTPGTVADFLAEIKEQGASGREERIMLTGNILAGYSMVQGQIVNYTDDQGKILQGILLRRSFDANRFIASQAQVLRNEFAKRWLADRDVSPPPFLVSSDGVVTISATDQPDTYFLDLPLSKKEGGDYYLDRFLRESMDKQEFVSKGNRMRGTFSARMVNRVVGGIENILKRKEAYLVSPHPAAKLWAERVGAAARGVGAAVRGVMRDERGGLDLDALMALLPKRMRDYLTTQSQGIAARAQRRWNTMFGRPSTPSITIEQPPAMKHLGPLAVEIKVPDRLFAGTGWEPIIRQGILAEEKQSDFIHRLSREYVQIRQRLNKAGGSFDTVSEALFAGDAMEIALTDTERLQEHFNEWGLAPAEIRAYRGVHNLLQKVARLVDMHNRSMMPGVLRQKREVWERMERILNQKRVTAPEARALYAERARLGRRVKNGKGDVAAAAARIDEINALLRQMRAEDPDTQAELNELQDTHDQLEARLAATGVRNRRAGYIPHKFFGNYRLWLQDGVDEEGNVQWREITSPQGFYSTMSEALTAAESIYAQNPDAILRIAERQVRWPDTLNGTELTDRAFFRFQGKLQESLPDATDAEIRDLLKGVARRRFRRRIYAPGMFRKGYQGYSEDLDRVMRTHIGQSVRYVIMDKLKHDYINRYERAGFSRSDAVLRPEQRALKDALDSWFRDVNGSKQKWEERLDNLLLTPAGPAKAVLTLGAGTLALGLAAGLGPILSPAVAGWLGWRMWKATKESGQFPTRTFQNAVLSDQAHLKLGMILNLHSALVNLTQTTLNTLPVMGTKYTAIGVKRATAALWAQATSKDSLDAVRLQRANIHTSFHLSDADRHLAQEDSKVARISMMAFQSVETFNRAVAYFAGLAKAEEEGLSVGRAHLAARAVVRRTQFHMGNANKPALLRKQFLRAPTQFKNFQFQEIAFAFGLDRKELPKFLLSMFLHAGVVGLPGMQLIDAMTKTLSGVSLSDAAKESVLKAATYGNYAVNAATMAAYGLPGYYHALTSSVGMGQNFLPTSPRDLAGPLFGTAYTLTEAEQKGAGLVDRLQVISPSFKTLKALEYAANGNPITSLGFWEGRNWQQHTVTDWRRRGQTVYHPDLRQLLMLGAGFTPIEQTIMQDAHYRTLREAEERRRKADVVLARIAQLTREGRSAEIGAVVAQARQDGIRLTQTMIQNARKGVFTTQPDRDLQRTPRDLRMEQYQRTQAIKGGLAPPAATE